MFHVDNNSAVPVMPAVKPVVSAVTSFFTEGGNGVPPTYPGPDWFNIIQSELLAVLAAAGITPDKASNVQLLAAMRALFLDTSQNGADIQDKALFLQNLGLTIGSSPGNVVTSGSTQPAYKTTLPSVGYTDLGQNGLVANADGEVDSVTKILTTLLTKSGAGGWGLGMSLGTYLGVGGTPDDLAHVLICTDGAAFSRRWYFYNNGKAVGPGGELALQDWVNTRLSTEMPVGVILAWPGATPPAGFLKCNGAGFTAAQYPKLAQVYPSLAVPDLRGEFLRGWDDGRNVDTGRTILSSQGFALQNITGDFGESTESTGQYATEFNAATGAFQKQSYLRNVMKISAFEQRQSSASVSFDASRVAQTATETRPRNIACNYIVRAA
ncbi:hypothetical protein AI2694V1_0395 [Enterobacter cloacae]|uniref:phage tail protein n=1 Tax=Citrobacter freundii TaxID=546 RepID=UPI001D75BCEA|nr:phage tail protein [Citrobacter freundii]CAE7049239.1 hypothetical protein AI2694V1_0395 [Enterobacter cloacae]CAE7460885.1 hypothetical protein AI2674V1_0395 [Enterobacter cloacae]CAE7479582.1 hypothetical protein AI2679V1_0395 [Enterobacter cloacae]CAH3485392.1 hypothetical protein AI2679V1_0395 [Enterobacter cloacae]CAH3486122.1 hypothetical protein AI2674V1_0395 [Enterobacter cloacae]